ncbi:hypothetical protein LEMLEM_LOCUS23227, partial [Lemmus lemmus]
KPAQNSAQRKQPRVAAAAVAAAATAGASRATARHSLEMYHPAYWIVFSATTALLFIPGPWSMDTLPALSSCGRV